MQPPKIILLGIAFLSLSACGVAAPLPPEQNSAPGSKYLSEALWTSENSTSPIMVMTSEELLKEPGTVQVSLPLDGSSYVHGVFLMDIPDRNRVLFKVRISHDLHSESVIARFRVQDGEDFPVLVEEVLRPSASESAQFEVDLSKYRGENRFIIFGFETDGELPSGEILLSKPEIVAQ